MFEMAAARLRCAARAGVVCWLAGVSCLISQAAAGPGGETNRPVLPTKLIAAPPDPAELGPPANPSEALRRKMQELKLEENRARRQAALTNAPAGAAPSAKGPLFQVKGYKITGAPLLPGSSLQPLFARHLGTNVSLEEIAGTALDVQEEYRRQGFPGVSVALAPQHTADGIVALNVFQGASPQVVVAGKRYVAPPPANTNPPATFPVRAYEVTGDTLLTEATMQEILGKYTGTNIGVPDILKAGSELQLEYRDRGYPTVNVTIPPQQITNRTVKIRVFEGQLASIVVTNNRYFSDANVRRALPGLRTNEVLVGPVFQSELDQANANQDRQIYPQIAPGPAENTSALILDVKDRLPLHGKVEFDNQNSPGTPNLRVNASAAYNNLWQLEHSFGIQYGFSPEQYKSGNRWSFYDLPLVANYSAFYRVPLGGPEAVGNTVTTSDGNFGYDEATRRFRLPAASGRPELNLYASGSTIDTGVETVFSQNLTNLTRRDVQQDITENGNIGGRLSVPFRAQGNFQSSVSFGGDFKTYHSSVYKTNTFTLEHIYVDEGGQWHTNLDTVVSPLPSPTGLTASSVEYAPVSLRYDGNLRDSRGSTSFGLGLAFNTWQSATLTSFQRISGSPRSSGNWVTVTPSLTRDFVFHTNWVLSFHADGQIASEPLVSNEQYGLGGVNSVRGYHEGEVFGDDGWRASLEQKTPAFVVGRVGRSQALVVRGSIYMDYGEVYLVQRPFDTRTPLWGAGAGWVTSLGTHWEARFLFSVPLLGTSYTEKYQPRFNFALSGQF
jgi:hemolysin activation/secretion protein